MEFGRFDQIEALKKEGYIDHSDCDFYEHEPICGGPSFLKAPDGKVHWVSCGKHAPISGTYLIELNEFEYAEAVYYDGKMQEFGLPRKKKVA